jgi:hypothetical protein
MIAQRLAYCSDHPRSFVTKLFDEELEKLLSGAPAEQHRTLREARKQTEDMILKGEFDPI